MVAERGTRGSFLRRLRRISCMLFVIESYRAQSNTPQIILDYSIGVMDVRSVTVAVNPAHIVPLHIGVSGIFSILNISEYQRWFKYR